MTMRKGIIRQSVGLSDELEKFLSTYAAAATAAGVGLLALTNAAQAKVVYTPGNTPILRNGGPVVLDLNHDGIPDFNVSYYYLSGDHGAGMSLIVGPESPSNRIWGGGGFGHAVVPRGTGRRPVPPLRGSFFASALRAGFKVGADQSYFPKGSAWMAWKVWNRSSTFNTDTGGQWWCSQPRYLGLQFVIKGKIHYGWAREQIKSGTFTLTGYAYETIPQKPIITGKTKGSDVITPEDASLGCLAQGASGIPAWRGNTPSPTGY